jgi:hypothetical protein
MRPNNTLQAEALYQLFSAHCSFMPLQNSRAFWNCPALLQALSYVFIAVLTKTLFFTFFYDFVRSK